MNADDIFTLARNKTPPPESMMLSERMLYTIARNIYKSYNDREISLEQARMEKRNAIREFDQTKLGEQIWKEQIAITLELSPISIEAQKHGCDVCRKMAGLLDRRILPGIRNVNMEVQNG